MRLICHKCTNYFLLRNFFLLFYIIYLLSISYLSLIYPLSTPYLPLIYPLSTPYLSPPLAQACSLCPIQNSKFKIVFHRTFSEGKSASWRSRVCDEGKSASWRSRVCEACAARIELTQPSM